jgi:ribosome biogenesis GTPase
VKTGRVIKSTGSHYQVVCDGTLWGCGVRGKLRISGLRTTNPVAVGDWVDFEPDDEGNGGQIVAIHPRSNYIIRRSVNLSKEAHVIASNVDQALVICTVARPRTSAGFIDRFLVTAEAYHIPAVIVFNKVDDLQSEDERLDLAILADTYAHAGYPVYKISARNPQHVQTMAGLLKDKVSLIAGHSGVGKSTLVNELIPGLNLKTSVVSESHNKGQHTTTFAEMHPLPFGGYIIDSPGIKGFGLVDLKPEDLPMLFPEMRALLPECRFYNCRHVNEPGCAVRQAVENGAIFPSRYKSYLSMLEDEDGGRKYREDGYE